MGPSASGPPLSRGSSLVGSTESPVSGTEVGTRLLAAPSPAPGCSGSPDLRGGCGASTPSPFPGAGRGASVVRHQVRSVCRWVVLAEGVVDPGRVRCSCVQSCRSARPPRTGGRWGSTDVSSGRGSASAGVRRYISCGVRGSTRTGAGSSVVVTRRFLFFRFFLRRGSSSGRCVS